MDSNNTNNTGLDSQVNENIPQTDTAAEPVMPEQPIEAPTEPVMPEQPTEAPTEPVMPEQPTEASTEPQPVPQPMPIQQPPKKKGKGGMLAVIIISVIVVLGLLIGGGMVVFGMLGSPESKVNRGFENLCSEMKEYQNPIMDKVQISEIMEKMNEEGSSIDTSLNITAKDSTTVGIDMTADVDTKNKEMNMDMALSVMNMSIASIEFAADEQNIFLSVPKFFDATLQLPVEGFAKKFNESELAYYIGTELPEDYDINLFSEIEEEETETETEAMFGEEFKEAYEQDVKAIAKSMQIEKYDETKEFSVDGKTVKCQGYSISAGKDEINQLYEDMVEELAYGKFSEVMIANTLLEMSDYGYTEEDIRDEWEAMVGNITIEIQDDLELIVYLDSKNRIVSLEAEETEMLIAEEVFVFNFEINFLGKERTLDQIEAIFEVSDGYQVMAFQLTRDADISKTENNDKWVLEITGDMDYNEHIKIEFVNNWNIEDMEYYIDALMQNDSDGTNFEIEASGSISDYEAGKNCTFEIDDVSVYTDSELTMLGSGNISFGIMEEAIEMPEQGWEILGATSGELEDFFMEIYENIYSMVGGYSY